MYLFIYDNQPTDQPRERNNTNRSYYHRQRTNRYPTQNERNTNNDNQSDAESENQQQQQVTNTTTRNKTQQQNQGKSKNNNLKKQQIHTNNRETLQVEKLKLHQQHNTILTQKHHHQLPRNSKNNTN